jgi:hypothetical protein
VPAPSPMQQFEHLRRAVGGRSNNARSSIANPSAPKSGGGGYTRGARGRQGTLSTLDTIRARLEALPCQDDSASVTLQDEDSLEQRLEEENSNTRQGRSKHLGARKGPQCTCFTGTKVQILTGRVPAGQTADGGPRGGLGALGAQFTCVTGKKVQILTGTRVQILRRTGGIRHTHGRSGTGAQRGQGRSQHLLDGVGWHRQALRFRPRY